MREFSIAYTNEFSFTTDWMSDTQDGFDLLRSQVLELADQFKVFGKKIDDLNGVSIEYYHLDSDNFGDDVVKWLVKFQLISEGIEETIEGLHPKIGLTATDLLTNDIIFSGEYEKCLDFLEKRYPNYNFYLESDMRKLEEILKVEEFQHFHIELN